MNNLNGVYSRNGFYWVIELTIVDNNLSYMLIDAEFDPCWNASTVDVPSMILGVSRQRGEKYFRLKWEFIYYRFAMFVYSFEC